MTDYLGRIWEIADELSGDVGDSLSARARAAVAGLDEAFLRAATALMLERQAHALWRSRNLRIERDAERAAAEAPAEQERGSRAEVGSHAGRYAPGSTNRRNRCDCGVCMAAWRKRQEIEDRHADRWVEGLNKAIAQFGAELKIEWTEELLSSGFKLADGTILIWADATVDQHRERIDMLVGNAAGNLEAAARHEAAIRAIEAAGAKTLGEALA